MDIETLYGNDVPSDLEPVPPQKVEEEKVAEEGVIEDSPTQEIEEAPEVEEEIEEEKEEEEEQEEIEEEEPEPEPEPEIEVEEIPQKKEPRSQKRIRQLIKQRDEARSQTSRLISECDRLTSELEELEETALQPPDIDNFENDDDYLEAKQLYLLDKREAQKLRTKIAKKKQMITGSEEVQGRINLMKSREKYKDFDDVFFGSDVKITGVMATAMNLVDNFEDVAYYLGKNPEKSVELASMSPAQQQVRIGQLSAKLATKKKVKKKTVSKAPPPVKTIKGKRATAKSISKMTMDEYAEYLKSQRGR